MGPRDISSVCIAPAFRQVVRLGASSPVLFTCLCLHAPQLVAASPSPVFVLVKFQFSIGRTTEHAAASWHHRAESLLLHGYSALRTTLSPTVTSWCELSALPCRYWPPHGSLFGTATPSSVSCPQVTHSAISPQVQTGPTRIVTSDVMSATLAEAATQLSFAEFLERCILLRASPPPLQPNPTLLLDAATQTVPHIAVSQDVSTQLELAEFLIARVYSRDPLDRQGPPSTHCNAGSASPSQPADIATLCSPSSTCCASDRHAATAVPRVSPQPPPGLEKYAHLCASHGIPV